jgi:ligand-binding SRPBCC domain-containing protein
VSDVEVSAQIAAPPEQVWEMVAEVTRMCEWSPETSSCRWIGGASGPVVGAKFKGTNRKGLHRWSTTCTVTAADPGRRFAFDVHAGPVPISTWEYDFTAADGGTAVTESWTDRRPAWMKYGSIPVTGVADRAGHNRGTMQATLAALRRGASSPAG